MNSAIKNGVLVVPLEGSVVGEYIRGPLMDLIKTNIEAGNTRVLFDMSQMKFVDSTGLGTLLSVVSKIKGAGGQLVLCNVPDQMTRLLKMTKLETAFNVQADESTALSILAG